MLSEGLPEVEQSDNGNDLLEICRDEIIRSQQKVKEIALLIEQSQGEVSRLTQKNSQLSSKLQLIKSQFATVPREDIREIYDSALDAQQRLFVMRGQVEKLTSDQKLVEHYLSVLVPICDMLQASDLRGSEVGIVQHTDTNPVEMMIQAQETERQRLARQMHDGPAQALSNFILQTEIALRLFDLDQTKAREELKNLMSSASVTLERVREFIFELRPMMLDDLGLGPTLKRYVESTKEQIEVEVNILTSGLETRLEAYLEVLIFRAVQELLANALKFSQATQVNIRVESSDMNIRVNVEDNGKGFDPDFLTNQSGMGLKVIRDRVEKLGGNFDIHSIPDQGTQISFQIPTAQVAVFA